MPRPADRAPAQFPLPLGWAADDRDADFLLTPASEVAARLLDRWRDWPVRTALLVGPPRSGRSTLARAFAAASGALVVDDADRVDEEALFHAWNRAETEGMPQLFVASGAPPAWAPRLPDLATRLAASPVAVIGPPDDALVVALLERGFERRRLHAPADLVQWLAIRIERRHAAIEAAVAAIVDAAAAQRRRPSVPLARETLARYAAFADYQTELP